jgi:SagB-type dehydrogenase family enzyme
LISSLQLRTFLFWVAGERYDPLCPNATAHPYPSAGASYPLQLYIIVYRSLDIDPGIYRYTSNTDNLTALPTGDKSALKLLKKTYASLGGVLISEIQCVTLITTRTPPTIYRRIALSNILKELGCVYQTMYLVAAAMGLAACAVGGGWSDGYGRILRTNPVTEPVIGEFLLAAH